MRKIGFEQDPIVTDDSNIQGLIDLAKSVPPPPVDTLPPELVDHPDYEIVRELGRGGANHAMPSVARSRSSSVPFSEATSASVSVPTNAIAVAEAIRSNL